MCLIFLLIIHFLQVMIGLTFLYSTITIIMFYSSINNTSFVKKEFVKVIIYKMKIININNHHLVTQRYGWNGGSSASMSSVWFSNRKKSSNSGFVFRQEGRPSSQVMNSSI